MPQEESVLRLGRDEALEAARLWQECGDAREFACRVLGSVMNALMDSEAQQMCGASRNERSDGRENSRNGYRPRSLKTAVGDVELEIPKLRHGTYYPEGMLARWSRVDTSVAAIVQEMYVCGVSTRKVERVASKLGISSLSSSEVSSLCSDLDAEVAEFRRRDLSGTPCCYLWLDSRGLRAGVHGLPQGALGQAPHQQRPGARQPRDQAPLQGRAVLPLEGVDAAPDVREPHGDRGTVVPAARVLRGLGRRGLRRARGQAGPDRGEAPRARAARQGDSGRDSREARSQEGVTSGLAATDLGTLLHHVCARHPGKLVTRVSAVRIRPLDQKSPAPWRYRARQISGAPGRIRTVDTRFRRYDLMLPPTIHQASLNTI